MVSNDELRKIVHTKDLNRSSIILLFLSINEDKPKSPTDLREIGVSCGLREVQNWNISNILSRSKPLVTRLPDGWELTLPGKKRVAELTDGFLESPEQKVATSLRQQLATVSNQDTRSFLEEAVVALETKCLRAAVVLSWVGAMSVLHDEVVKNHLAEFNTEAKKYDNKNNTWKDAKNADELSKLSEARFLEILESISVIGKNVKQELKNCLDRRNACGHPNTYKIGEHNAASHVEFLILNVFSKLPLK